MATAFVGPSDLPGRVRQWTYAQVAAFERFQQEHGDDPTEWPESVRLAFASEMARLAPEVES